MGDGAEGVAALGEEALARGGGGGQGGEIGGEVAGEVVVFREGGVEGGALERFEEVGEAVGGEGGEEIVVVRGDENHGARWRRGAEVIEREAVAELDIGEDQVGRGVGAEPLR
jgi:hypothetical protein